MNDAGTDMVGDDSGDTPNPFLPAPEDLQHWASVMARAQQMMLDHALGQVEAGQGAASLFDPARWLDSDGARLRSEEHTSELQSLMRISYAVFCLKKKKK